jgi:hypothetical protein
MLCRTLIPCLPALYYLLFNVCLPAEEPRSPPDTANSSPANSSPETSRPDSSAASSAESRHRDIRALSPLAVLVGEWRAVGQPQRGSNAGAWTEEISAAWSFQDGRATLITSSGSGKQFRQMVFSSDPKSDDLRLLLKLPDQSSILMQQDRVLSSDAVVVFVSAPDQPRIIKCSVRRISDIRATLLFEQQMSEAGSFRRMAEIGCTRAGEKLARGNSGERQCIVTGGLGTMAVMYSGMTFYVCCEGCRQAFTEDPEGTIAAYRERLKAKP